MTSKRRIPRYKKNSQPYTFWFERFNNISLIAVDGVYQQFTYVNPIAQPSLQQVHYSLAMPSSRIKTLN